MAEKILVIAEQQQGRLHRQSWEALAAGQQLGDNVRQPCVVAVAGKGIDALGEELAAKKVEEVWLVEHDLLERYTPDGYALALRQLVEQLAPSCVFLPHTYQVRDFAPKLAASLRRGLISDCIGFRAEDTLPIFVRLMFQGKTNANVTFAGEPPWFATFQAGAFRGDAVAAGSRPAPVKKLEPTLEAAQIRTRPEEPFREAKQAVDLTQASIIVAVGRGIKDPGNIELARKLASLLGGELAASRPICDEGWLPMERQVGSSGQTVAPKLYLALGISGAIQHVVGMKGARTIVAINKDANAPIFEVADYGIVGDLFEVVPALIEELEKGGAGG
ncbi:MAG: electron transfer flavoprotein subunit alpha/FixB family protein [Terriglobia bacterium]